jgi:hypothetical protein
MPDQDDAIAAAARATGSDPIPSGGDPSDAEGVAPDHADAEGAPDESTIGNSSRWREMLLSSDPDKPLEQVDTPWAPELGGRNRIMRGFQKMLDFSGLPAIVDITIGALEELSKMEAEDDGDQDDAPVASDDVQETDGGSSLV